MVSLETKQNKKLVLFPKVLAHFKGVEIITRTRN